MSTHRQDVVDALVWLDLARCRALLHALLKGPESGWQPAVDRLVPELRGHADVGDPAWREALLEELELRVAGDHDEPDDIATTEVPNLVRFATDLREPKEE